MSKKILAGAVVALIAIVVGVASMVFFAKAQPTEAEVRAAVESTLPDGAMIDQMTFAVFSDDRSKGRVSVKGTYSFDHDIFSLPTPPVRLLKSLSTAQIFDNDLSRWWSENSSFYPQFKGKLGEFQKTYSSGEGLEFSGELPFLAVVDGTKVDSSSLAYMPMEGTITPAFGYADDAAKVAELTAAISQWRDILKEEAAAAAAAAHAQQLERERQEAELEATRTAALAAEQLELERQAAKIAAARVIEEAKAAEEIRLALMQPEILPCNPDSWAASPPYRECVQVVFSRAEQVYQRSNVGGDCLVNSNSDLVKHEPLGGGDHIFRSARPDQRVSVEFFILPEGETYNGATC